MEVAFFELWEWESFYVREVDLITSGLEEVTYFHESVFVDVSEGREFLGEASDVFGIFLSLFLAAVAFDVCSCFVLLLYLLFSFLTGFFSLSLFFLDKLWDCIIIIVIGSRDLGWGYVGDVVGRGVIPWEGVVTWVVFFGSCASDRSRFGGG